MDIHSTSDTPAAPPPLAPPPVLTPPPPSRSKGRIWMVLALILLLFLIVSVIANFGLLVGGMMPFQSGFVSESGPRLQEVVVQDQGARDKVAVIEVEGIIRSDLIDGRHSLVDVIKAKLKRAAEDQRVAAVVLKVDSPGGEVLASDEICKALQEFQEVEGKPVVASMGGLAASGGYYISAPCRWIVANDLTITGSIGVILSTWNYRGLMDKVGLLPQVYKSGVHKDMLSGDRLPSEIPADEKVMLQAFIDQAYQKFKGVVQDGRDTAHEENGDEGRKLIDDWVQYADGRILSGTDAYTYGFVDELGDFDTAVARAEELGGVFSANVVRYEHIPAISQLLRLLGKSDARTVKVDWGLDLPELRAGKLYYLAPSLVE